MTRPRSWQLFALTALLLAFFAVEQHDPARAQGNLPKRTLLLSAVSSTGTSAAFDAIGCSSLALFASGTGTLSTGVITLEEADYNPSSAAVYAGTWASLGTVTPVSGAQLVLRPTGGNASVFRYVRARVSTTVTGGGSVSAVLTCR